MPAPVLLRAQGVREDPALAVLHGVPKEAKEGIAVEDRARQGWNAHEAMVGERRLMAQKYGYLANAEEFDRNRACLVCDDPQPNYSWTDLSGEGYCLRCGTPYQLKWGTLTDGEDYPRCNIRPEWIPPMRTFWKEKQKPNGQGTFLGFGSYPDQLAGREAFNSWCHENESLLPKEKESNDP